MSGSGTEASVTNSRKANSHSWICWLLIGISSAVATLIMTKYISPSFEVVGSVFFPLMIGVAFFVNHAVDSSAENTLGNFELNAGMFSFTWALVYWANFCFPHLLTQLVSNDLISWRCTLFYLVLFSVLMALLSFRRKTAKKPNGTTLFQKKDCKKEGESSQTVETESQSQQGK